jgi:tetratricopeptide (TPR) repeat protein
MPEVKDHDITKSELRKMIEQIRSIDFELPKDTFEPAVVVPESVPKNEPNEIAPKDVKEQQKKVPEKHTKISGGMITTQTLEIIKKISQNPGDLENPFELGETLFLSGYIGEAVIFYREALKRKSPDKADSAQDRAWILFQIGNCLRDVDRPEAINTYGQLITEYPNSPWKELAEVRRALLDWYLKEEPSKLLKERRGKI